MTDKDKDIEYFEDAATDATISAEPNPKTESTKHHNDSYIACDITADEMHAEASAAKVDVCAEGMHESTIEGEEFYDIEFNEDAIVAYLEDDDGNEIGFVLLENGEEVEYYYAEESVSDYASGHESVASDEEELYELEFSEDSVVAYLEDEDGIEIGVVVLEDDREVEYYYAEEDIEYGSSGTHTSRAEDVAPGMSYQDIADTTANLNAVFKEGVLVKNELKEAFSDITSSFMSNTQRRK